MDVTGSTARDDLERLLAECVSLGASDLHLAPGLPPVFRIGGALRPRPDAPPLGEAAVARLAGALLETGGRAGLDATGSQDGALSAAGARFRFNVFRRMGALAAAVRRLEDSFRTLGDLGLPESLYSLCDAPDGIVVIAGPTGAGKSTTLAAFLDRINATRRAHVITIEDPIEYLHQPKLALVNQRQVGSDARSFHDALVAALREDPDVILVGEIRDLETIRTALRAAETGHLVLTTVHAGDCVGAVERIVSVFPAEEQAGIRQQLSLVLRAVIAQRLLPEDGPAAAGRTGPASRVVACEVLHGTPAVSHLVATGRSSQLYAAIESGARHGMHTLEGDLARLVLSGRISEAAASVATRHPAIVRDRLDSLRRGGSGGVRPANGVLR